MEEEMPSPTFLFLLSSHFLTIRITYLLFPHSKFMAVNVPDKSAIRPRPKKEGKSPLRPSPNPPCPPTPHLVSQLSRKKHLFKNPFFLVGKNKKKCLGLKITCLSSYT